MPPHAFARSILGCGLRLWAVLLAACGLVLASGCGDSTRPAGSGTDLTPVAATPAGLDGQVYSLHLTFAPAGTGCTGGSPPSPVKLAALFRRQGGALTFSLLLPPDDVAPERGVMLTASGQGYNFQHAAAPLSDTRNLTLDRGTLRFFGGAAHSDDLQLSGSGTVRTFIGDVVTACAVTVSGTGPLDRSAPAVQLQAATPLLADAPITLRFSKPVAPAAVSPFLSAMDSSGAVVPVYPLDARQPGFTLSLHGSWPLGRTVTLTVAAGVPDTAGHTLAASMSQGFAVVADPGPLQNGGFESGDLTGFVAEPGAALEVVRSYLGVQPAEGAYLLVAGDPAQSSRQTITLTAHLTIPAGATQLRLDYDLLSTFRIQPIPPYPLLSVSVQGTGSPSTAEVAFPKSGSALPGQTLQQSGWTTLTIPLSGLAGQDVSLTLHLDPTVIMAAPPTFGHAPGVLLLDNIRVN